MGGHQLVHRDLMVWRHQAGMGRYGGMGGHHPAQGDHLGWGGHQLGWWWDRLA